jgi:hypothetical protein
MYFNFLIASTTTSSQPAPIPFISLMSFALPSEFILNSNKTLPFIFDLFAISGYVIKLSKESKPPKIIGGVMDPLKSQGRKDKTSTL